MSGARSQAHRASLPAQRAPGAPRRPAPQHVSPHGAHLAGARARARDPLLPGSAVAGLSLLTTATVAVLDRAWTERLSQFFDLCFVLVCIVAALVVRRSGLFTVGVLPPLALVTVLAVFTVIDPATLTASHLAFASTLLTALAHHAEALVSGHGSALAVLVARGAFGDDTPEAT